MKKKSLPKPLRRVLLIQSVAFLVLLIPLSIGARQYFKRQYIASMRSTIHDLIETVYKHLPAEISHEWCNSIAKETHFRFSVISTETGFALCDTNYYDQKKIPLLDRPEVIAALQSPTGYADSVRFSQTLNETTFYGTRYLKEKKIVLRVGFRLSELVQTINVFDRVMIVGVLIFAFGTLFLFWILNQRIVLPLTARFIEKSTAENREDFLAHVSHELRTPLTSIKGFSQTLLQDIDSGAKVEREFVEIIANDSNRLLGMVNDLLDLSALDSGTLSVVKEPVDTKQVTSQVLSRLNSVYGTKNQVVHVATIDTPVAADPDRLTQILLNIIGNAMKYSPAKTEIAVHWELESHSTKVRITDHGPGISKEDQEKLFQRFYRARTTGEPGSGLGLAIVQELMELHGGKIELASTLGQGTSVTLIFPNYAA